MNNQTVLILNQKIQLPINKTTSNLSHNKKEIATIIYNFVYYGYIPSLEVYNELLKYSKEELNQFWLETKDVLEEITMASKNMGDYAVYKNFPTEVLALTEAEYWLNQFLIYFNVPYEYVVEQKEERQSLKLKIENNKDLKVLSLAEDNALDVIFENLMKSKSKWTLQEEEIFAFLLKTTNVNTDLNVDDFVFKSNGVKAISLCVNDTRNLIVPNANDVLRLAKEISLKNIKNSQAERKNKKHIYKLNKKEKRFLLSLLETSKNLEDDFAMKKVEWKKFMKYVHPSDFNFVRVNKAYDKLYNGLLRSHAQNLEAAKKTKNLELLNNIPNGILLREIHSLYNVFGIEVLNKINFNLATIDYLAKLEKYFETFDKRENFIYRPNGDWTKSKFIEKQKQPIKESDKETILLSIRNALTEKLNVLFPDGIVLDENVKNYRLPTNDLELDAFGRGSEFYFDKTIKTIRTGSYWKMENICWFDNGVNFYEENFVERGAICWNNITYKGAVFSGDPVNSDDNENKATQFIDLNIEELKKNNIRYCLWTLLSFSYKKFNLADELVATLQLTEDSKLGKLYEPSLAKFKFKVGGDSLSKYLVLIDLKESKLIFLDANISTDVESTYSSQKEIKKKLSFLMEHLKSQPTVYDVFKYAKKAENINEKTVYIVDEDINYNIVDKKAIVFNKNNMENKIIDIDLKSLLSK